MSPPLSIGLEPIHPHADQAVLDDLKRRLNDAPPFPETFETLGNAEQPLGVTKAWLDEAVAAWKQLDWRKIEDHIDTFEDYLMNLELDGHTYNLHYVALFSDKPDAVPVCFVHGWPGSFLEFLPMISHLEKTYTPDQLPIHMIMPSLVGYGCSSPPPTDRNFVTPDNGILFNKLMQALGYNSYVGQGGDVGGMVAPLMGEAFDEVKAVHINYLRVPPEHYDETDLDEYDERCVERLKHVQRNETAYAIEHGTKTSTISMVVQSSPIALLPWIGERFLVWSDPSTRPSMETILSDVMLYYVQSTFATGLYHYRGSYSAQPSWRHDLTKLWTKPMGFSLFPYELRPSPLSWVKKWKPNIVWTRRHERGGHFAALECPVELWEDVHDFIQAVWKQ